VSLNGPTTVTGANTLTTTTGLATLGGGLTMTGGTAMIGNGGTTVHIVSQDAGGPTQSAIGTGIGTGGSCTTTGNQSDTVGVLRITTGTTPAVNALVCTMNYTVAYTAVQSVVLFPADPNAAFATYRLYVTNTTTGFSVFAGANALGASLVHDFQYIIIGR
jgi:hypothetical protein